MIGLSELIVLLGVFHFILWLIATIRILTSKFVGYYKIIWLLIVLVVPVIGPIAYFAIGKKQKMRVGEDVEVKCA
ncbi:MAG: PLDc_N domain-containing protein [Deltaproteobacteria bacterium]|nr:PLDc_N domain-containing protein [Deltaproteobacteria bacterium]